MDVCLSRRSQCACRKNRKDDVIPRMDHKSVYPVLQIFGVRQAAAVPAHALLVLVRPPSALQNDCYCYVEGS
jgi:hypothetical protein